MFFEIDMVTEKMAGTTWRRPELDTTAENMYKAVIKKICYFWVCLSFFSDMPCDIYYYLLQVEFLLDPEITAEVRTTAAARIKRLSDSSLEQSFKDIMQFAITIGYAKTYY